MKLTIQGRMAATKGHASGFDYLRILLALAILSIHAVLTSGGQPALDAVFAGPARPLVRFLLPAFFALSGFLVAGSLERCRTLGLFLALRVLRIYPALLVETVLSACLLGPWLTTLPLSDYFGSPLFWHYLRNMFGDVHFYLPGVFTGNPYPKVNAQLWTVPFELGAYVTLALLALAGLKRHRLIVPVATLLLSAGYAAQTWARFGGNLDDRMLAPLRGSLLVLCFLAGLSVYLYRERLPWNAWLAALCLLLTAVLLSLVPGGDCLVPMPAAYATIYLGLLNPPRRLLRGADYSYGIFLYSFVVEQAAVQLLPARDWRLNLAVSLPLSVALAAFSWHCVEQPAQRFRETLKQLENRWLARRPKAIVAGATD